jgi:hypothetical protein
LENFRMDTRSERVSLARWSVAVFVFALVWVGCGSSTSQVGPQQPVCGGAGQACCAANACNGGGCCVGGVCRGNGTMCMGGAGTAGTCTNGSCQNAAGQACGALTQACCMGNGG